jgi:hypothetical protein
MSKQAPPAYTGSNPELDTKVEAEQIEHSGKAVLADGRPYIPDTTEEKALVRKIDKHLLPMLWIMYVMNYIDRTNIGVSYLDLLSDNTELMGRTPKSVVCRLIWASRLQTTLWSYRSSS